MTVFVDESSVEIGESKESLKILYRKGQRSVLDSLHLPLVHLDSLLVYDVAQKLHSGGVKLTFFQFQVRFVSSQFLQNQSDVALMLRER